VVVVLLVDNITTEPIWISTIQVTSERSVCDTSTSKATTSGSQLSTWTRYVLSGSLRIYSTFGMGEDSKGLGFMSERRAKAPGRFGGIGLDFTLDGEI